MRQLPIAARVALSTFRTRSWWAFCGSSASAIAGAGNIAWFIALAIFAVEPILTPYVTPALMLANALVLLKLSPRPGILYEATSFPSIRAFLGFTLLAAMSIKWGADLFGMELLLENLQSVPLDAVGAGVCAVAVGVFIASAKLRYRRVQPCGAAIWLTAGILTCAGGALAAHLPSKIPYGSTPPRIPHHRPPDAVQGRSCCCRTCHSARRTSSTDQLRGAVEEFVQVLAHGVHHRGLDPGNESRDANVGLPFAVG